MDAGKRSAPGKKEGGEAQPGGEEYQPGGSVRRPQIQYGSGGDRAVAYKPGRVG
jgi:hypothetical protein